jgi:hypothetical protein
VQDVIATTSVAVAGITTARALATRRSPVLLGVVSAAHGLVLFALLQTPGIVPRLDPARGEARLDVVLLESTSRDTAPVRNLPPPVEAPISVELPELPALEVEPAAPSAEEPLQGLYLGQVRARISRAWEALGVVPSPALPDCTVRLTQSDRGEVLEVMVSECTLDTSTRALLERAVRASGPLPAPPASLPTQASIEFSLAVAR